MIITDETILRQKCEPVDVSEIDSIRLLLETELAASADRGEPGIGLSAPQIGIFKRMAIVRVPVGKSILKIDLVNCKIANFYDKAIFENEGCLSFPGKRAKTYRYKEIHVIDNMVKPYSFIATGLFGVCIQHELDHLDGKLLPDVAISSVNNPIVNKFVALDEINLSKSISNIFKSKK